MENTVKTIAVTIPEEITSVVSQEYGEDGLNQIINAMVISESENRIIPDDEWNDKGMWMAYQIAMNFYAKSFEK